MAASVAPGGIAICRVADNAGMTVPPSRAAPAHPVVALLEANCPGGTWTAAHVRALDERVRVRRLAAGATLFAQGSVSPGMFGVLSGEIELRFSPADGHGSVVERAAAGRLFGLASFVTGTPSAYEAVALVPTRLAVVGPAAYDWLMDEMPGFGRRLMKHFATRLDATLRLLASSRHLGSEARLAQALQQLRREGHAVATGRNGPWEVAVTQSGLAELAGVTRQTANEWLAAWGAKGWVETGYRRLVVRRWPAAT
jgi:CRP-like cAMP-binding protein